MHRIFKKQDNEWKNPSGTNWKRVLHKFYNHAPNHFDNMKQVADELKISINEVGSATDFLKIQKLIKVEGTEQKYYVITEKGFNVALQNEKEVNDMKIQFAFMSFSAIVAVATLADFFIKIRDYTPYNYFYIVFFIVFLLILNWISGRIKL